MNYLKNAFFAGLGVTVIIWSFYTVLQQPAPARYQNTNNQRLTTNSQIRIGDESIPVEIADTDAERNLGLSGRAILENGHGLLFIFDTSSKYGFWMKDMRFPIDIVWIDENWRIISVTRNVAPETYPKVFEPERAIRYALELNAGEAEKFGIDTGLILSLEGQI